MDDSHKMYLYSIYSYVSLKIYFMGKYFASENLGISNEFGRWHIRASRQEAITSKHSGTSEVFGKKSQKFLAIYKES